MKSEDDENFSRLCFWLFFATRGGRTRLVIMQSLMREPMNAHRLSSELGLNYRTVEHHLRVLAGNGFVTAVGRRYGETFFPSKKVAENGHRITDMIEKYGGKA